MNFLRHLNYKYLGLILISICSLSLQAMNEDKEDATMEHTMDHATKSSVVVLESWIRLTPPVATNSAAYFTIQNKSDKDVTVVEVSTAIAESSAMHDVEIKNSMVRMVHLPQLIVPAGGNVVFAPGGKHLMLINLTKKLQDNQEVSVIFKLDSGEKIIAKMQVMRQAPSSTDNKKDDTAEHQH